MQNRRTQLERRMQQFERDAALVADQNAKTSDTIDLNIGGERTVKVARRTLALVENSMLGAMFSGRHTLQTDDTGNVYIDRDPRHVFSFSF